MFPDEYIQYIIDLPIKPKENINENVQPKWITNPLLDKGIPAILIGCKNARNCKDGPQCPFLHPCFDNTNTNTTQVTTVYTKDHMTV